MSIPEGRTISLSLLGYRTLPKQIDPETKESKSCQTGSARLSLFSEKSHNSSAEKEKRETQSGTPRISCGYHDSKEMLEKPTKKHQSIKDRVFSYTFPDKGINLIQKVPDYTRIIRYLT